mmetsp:Transcript_120884/g.386123  ORF Transcript_120884/g.386123 Transcript_120884/m.386123 type:complete len:243 (+) Transcript_120884:51-779(+)
MWCPLTSMSSEGADFVDDGHLVQGAHRLVSQPLGSAISVENVGARQPHDALADNEILHADDAQGHRSPALPHALPSIGFQRHGVQPHFGLHSCACRSGPQERDRTPPMAGGCGRVAPPLHLQRAAPASWGTTSATCASTHSACSVRRQTLQNLHLLVIRDGSRENDVRCNSIWRKRRQTQHVQAMRSRMRPSNTRLSPDNERQPIAEHTRRKGLSVRGLPCQAGTACRAAGQRAMSERVHKV